MDAKQVGNQVYYDGIGGPDGFAHGHYNGDTGYNRPAVGGENIENTVGWAAVMGAAGKHNIDIGGTPS